MIQHRRQEQPAFKRQIILAWLSDLPRTPQKPRKGKMPPRRSKRVAASRGRPDTKSGTTPRPPSLAKRGRSPVTRGRSPAKRGRNYHQSLKRCSEVIENSITNTRTTSPSKTRQDLESAVPRILCREVVTAKEDVLSLDNKLKPVALYEGIFPLSLKVGFRTQNWV